MSTAILQQRPILDEPGGWTFPQFDEAVLAGGLTVWFKHLPGQGIVSAQLLLDAPITVEPLHLAGVGQVTAKALTQGTARRDADAFASALDRAAAQLSAGAGAGATHVSLSAPASRLRDALGLLAEAVLQPTLPAREVTRLVRQRFDGIRREYADPSSRAALALRAAIFDPAERLHLPGGGSAETVARIDRDAVATFHLQHLTSRRARLVVAGDLTGVDIIAEVEAVFDGWPGTAAERLPALTPATSTGPRLIVVDRPGASQTLLHIGAAGPDRHAADWVDLRVALYALGGTLTSRLDAVLREAKGYTYGMRSKADSLRRGGQLSLASGSLQTEVTEQAVLETLAIIGAFALEGLRDDERKAAVDYLAGVQPLQLETAAALAGTVAGNLEHDLAADHTARELRALRAVTTEGASAAADARVRIDQAVVVAVGDATRIVPGLDGLGHAPVEIVEDPSFLAGNPDRVP